MTVATFPSERCDGIERDRGFHRAVVPRAVAGAVVSGMTDAVAAARRSSGEVAAAGAAAATAKLLFATSTDKNNNYCED